MRAINTGLWVTLGLPAFAIAASVGVAVIAFTRGDPPLPAEYHWEGMSLDRDFADARRAAELEVRSQLQMLSGTCSVKLQLKGSAPAALRLRLTHGTRPDLDREVWLKETNGSYAGVCGAVPEGLWHVQLSDENGSWSVRKDVTGSLQSVAVP